MTALPWQTIDKADKSKPQIVGWINEDDWAAAVFIRASQQWHSVRRFGLRAINPQPTHYLPFTPPGTAQADVARGTFRAHGHTMALGCCSAICPCSHQQRDPNTICDHCRDANALGLASGTAQEASAVTEQPFDAAKLLAELSPPDSNMKSHAEAVAWFELRDRLRAEVALRTAETKEPSR